MMATGVVAVLAVRRVVVLHRLVGLVAVMRGRVVGDLGVVLRRVMGEAATHQTWIRV